MLGFLGTSSPCFLFPRPVIYWPSTEPSIKRCTCVNKRKNSEIGASGRRYRNITLTGGRGCIRWWWQMRTPTGSRWESNKNITMCHRRLGAVSSSFSWSWSWSQLRDKMPAWEPAADKGLWALSDPRLSSPARMRKKCCYGQKNLGSICSSLSPSPTHLSHTTNINPFENKERERYIFIKKCVRSFIEVDYVIVYYVSAYICICMWLYNSPTWRQDQS